MNSPTEKKLNILIVGQSGSGKSSTINILVNLASNTKFEDKRLFAIPASFTDGNDRTVQVPCDVDAFKIYNLENNLRVGESVTKSVNVYPIQTNGLVLNLIDTPGFGDTRGAIQDVQNTKYILQCLQKLKNIHAIILASKGSENRISRELIYSIDQFRNLLPKGCEKNIFVLFTHVGNSLSVNAQEILKALSVPMTNTFMFENSCLIPCEILKTFEQRYPEDVNEMMAQEKKFWTKNQRNFEKLIQVLQTITPMDATMIHVFQSKKLWFERLIHRWIELRSQLDQALSKKKSAEIKTTNPVKKTSNYGNANPKHPSYWQIKVKSIQKFGNLAQNKANDQSKQSGKSPISLCNLPSSNQSSNKTKKTDILLHPTTKPKTDFSIASPKPAQPKQTLEIEHQKQEHIEEEIDAVVGAIVYLEDLIARESQTGTAMNFRSITMLEDQILYLQKDKSISESERVARISQLKDAKSKLQQAFSLCSQKNKKSTGIKSFEQLVSKLLNLIMEDSAINPNTKKDAVYSLVEIMNRKRTFDETVFEQMKPQINDSLDEVFRMLYTQERQQSSQQSIKQLQTGIEPREQPKYSQASDNNQKGIVNGKPH